jgi:hypothetical protein
VSSHGSSPRACVCGGAAAVVAICSARAVGKTAYNRISAHSHAFGWSNLSPHSCSDCATSAGSRVVMLQSNFAERKSALSVTPRSPPSSCGLRSTSLSQREAQSSRRSRRHPSSQSSSRWHWTRLAVAWTSLARPGPTSPAFPYSRRICQVSDRTFASSRDKSPIKYRFLKQDKRLGQFTGQRSHHLQSA